MNTTTYKFNVARNRDTTAYPVELTLDWEGCTPEYIRELATKTVVIKVQQPRSKAKTDAALREAFPETMAIRVADIAWGPARGPRGPRDPVARTNSDMAALTPEQRLAVLKENAALLPPELRKGLFED